MVLNTLYKQIQPLSRIKTLNGHWVRRISPVGEEKAYGRKDLPKSKEWKKERVREDESGDSEDGEDELPCVIGGEREGDSIWSGLRSSVGSWLQRQDAAYWKEWLVICGKINILPTSNFTSCVPTPA